MADALHLTPLLTLHLHHHYFYDPNRLVDDVVPALQFDADPETSRALFGANIRTHMTPNSVAFFAPEHAELPSELHYVLSAKTPVLFQVTAMGGSSWRPGQVLDLTIEPNESVDLVVTHDVCDAPQKPSAFARLTILTASANPRQTVEIAFEALSVQREIFVQGQDPHLHLDKTRLSLGADMLLSLSPVAVTLPNGQKAMRFDLPDPWPLRTVKPDTDAPLWLNFIGTDGHPNRILIPEAPLHHVTRPDGTCVASTFIRL